MNQSSGSAPGPAPEGASRKGPPSGEIPWEALAKDMRQALLSEIGARSIYDHLSRRVADEELARLLLELNRDGARTVGLLQAVIRDLGGRPKRTSLRRRAMARALCASSYVVGVRVVLRICAHAEETVSRWYNEYSAFFLGLGDYSRARSFRDLSLEKQLRSRALGAWIANVHRRG